MEPNKKIAFNEGLGSWAKTPFEPRPLSDMTPSNLPLPPPAGSFEGWKPYWMNHVDGSGGSGSTSGASGSSSGVNKTHFQPMDVNSTANRPDNTPAPISVTDDSDDDSDHDEPDAGAGDQGQNNNRFKTVILDGVEVKVGRNVDVDSMDPKRLRR